MATHVQAAIDSLNAALWAFEPSPLDPYKVAQAVGMQRGEDEHNAAQKVAEPEVTELHTPSLLGCWINGKLRFQSRDHEAIHGYARAHMTGSKNFGNNVWVAPVGSFVTAEQASKKNARKARKVAEAAA